MFQPEDKVSIVLEAQQWNAVIAVLSKGPYEVVAPLIQEINQQAAANQPPEPAGVQVSEEEQVVLPPTIMPPKHVNGRPRAR